MKLQTSLSVPCPHCAAPLPVWADADLTALVRGKHLITGMRHAPHCPTCGGLLFSIATPARPPTRPAVAVVVTEQAATRTEPQRVAGMKLLLMLALSALLSGRFGQAAGHLYRALAQ